MPQNGHPVALCILGRGTSQGKESTVNLMSGLKLQSKLSVKTLKNCLKCTFDLDLAHRFVYVDDLAKKANIMLYSIFCLFRAQLFC